MKACHMLLYIIHPSSFFVCVCKLIADFSLFFSLIHTHHVDHDTYGHIAVSKACEKGRIIWFLALMFFCNIFFLLVRCEILFKPPNKMAVYLVPSKNFRDAHFFFLVVFLSLSSKIANRSDVSQVQFGQKVTIIYIQWLGLGLDPPFEFIMYKYLLESNNYA